MPALNGLPSGPREQPVQVGMEESARRQPVAGRDDDHAPPVPLPRPFQLGRPGKPAQVCDGHLVHGLSIRLPAVRVRGGHEPENVIAPEGVTDHHIGEPFIHERMTGWRNRNRGSCEASKGGAGELCASSQVSCPSGRSMD